MLVDNDYLIDQVKERAPYLQGDNERSDRVLEALRKVDRKQFIPTGLGSDFPYIQGKYFNAVVDALNNIKKGTKKAENDFVKAIKDMFSTARIIKVDEKDLAYNDISLLIGNEQTCSEPSMVAFIADHLKLEPEMKVLSIGTGSGYLDAIVSHLIEPGGKVVTVERIKELSDLAKVNLKSHFGKDYRGRFKFIVGDGSIGYKKAAPYDRIVLSAGVKNADNYDLNPLADQLADDGIIMVPEIQGSFFVFTKEQGRLVDPKSYGNVSFVPLIGRNDGSPKKIKKKSKKSD